MTKYARDEFDKVPEVASRQGVHRTASAPSRVRLWPVLAVGIAALAIGLVSFLVLPTLGLGSQSSQASSSLEASPVAGTGSTPSASAEGSPTPSAEPSVPEEPEPTADAEPSTAPPAASVDKTQGVAVYNAAGRAGLAGQVSGTVQADGWTLGQVGNWAGAPMQTSVIFYAGPERLASAQALAELLSIPTLVDSTEFQLPLVVVLGPGYL